MSFGTLIPRLKSASVFMMLFPLITIVLMTIVKPIATLHNLVGAAVFFSSPGMLVLHTANTIPPFWKFFVMFVHFPAIGFLTGFIFPFEIALTRSLVKHIAARYLLCIFYVLVIGVSITFYAFAHDS